MKEDIEADLSAVMLPGVCVQWGSHAQRLQEDHEESPGEHTGASGHILHRDWLTVFKTQGLY